MSRLQHVLVAVTVALTISLVDATARADEDPAYLSFGAGYFDVVQQDDTAADFRLEYRHDGALWFLKPWGGIEVTTKGSVYGVAGILADLYLGQHFVITPSFGVGAYSEGSGKDLGSVLEFRSQIEAGYRFEDRSRVSVAFSHISNASIGDENPGTEIVSLYYHLPIDRLF